MIGITAFISNSLSFGKRHFTANNINFEKIDIVFCINQRWDALICKKKKKKAIFCFME